MAQERRVAVLFIRGGWRRKVRRQHNDLLKAYGMSCSSLVSTYGVLHGLHPKEVLPRTRPAAAVANKHLVISGKRKTKREQLKGDQLKEATANGGLSFAYPRGLL